MTVRLALPARVFYCVHAPGGHRVRLKISSKDFDPSIATLCDFFMVFADATTAVWTCNLTPDPAAQTFVQDVTAGSVYAYHTLGLNDLDPAQVGDATLDAVITIGGQEYACDQRILTVTP